MAQKNVIGESYGRMTITADVDKPGNRRVIARCECGAVKEVLLGSLRSGATTSCGCYHKEVSTTHGESKNKDSFYRVWASMKSRCNDPQSQKYADYGARGITVCQEWDSYEPFRDWATITYIDGMSLDRARNNEGYSPSNCRWVTKATQSRNQRARKDGTSQYIGVSLVKETGKWLAGIGLNGKRKHIGVFDTDLEAAIARDTFIIQEGLTDFTMNNVL